MLSLLFLSCAHGPAERAPELTLSALEPDQSVHGFTVEALYLDDQGDYVGARFLHDHTGFELDLLRLETAPQAYIWVDTPGDSDRGEPHTQEHLLLGKGNRGRAVANQEALSLVESSAFTAQLHTAYHLHTTAGPEAFAATLHDRIDALLHPDYTDEEIRREVHHFGPKTTADGTLWLEEKGTVYNEMVSSFSGPWGRLWHGLGGLLYGPDHPAAVSQGGEPAAIRTMTPDHIKEFHAHWYRLDRMGMIGVWPRSVPLDALLGRLDDSLVALQPEPSDGSTAPPLPEPVTDDDRSPRSYAYPGDATAPAGVVVAWPPAARESTAPERLLQEAVLDTLAADNGELYASFVHPDTRVRDAGVREVDAFTRDPRDVIMVGLDGMPGDTIDAEGADLLRTDVVEVLRTVDEATGDQRADFARRLDATLVSHARSARQRIASPPGFGVRGTGTAWYDHLELLARGAGTHRALSFRETYGELREAVAAGAPWSALTGRLVDEVPFVAWRQPSPATTEALASDRAARLAAEVARLAERHEGDEQAALEAFAAAYEADTAELEALAEGLASPGFLDAPPLGQDDGLDWHEEDLGVPSVISRFVGLSSGTIGLAFDARRVSPHHRVLLPLLGPLLSRVGVIEDGTPVSWDAMTERLSREVGGLSAWWDTHPGSGRVELALEASGTTPDEAAAALHWLRLVILSPDWRVENLTRIRSLVDERYLGLLQRSAGREESWVMDPATAWAHQDDALLLTVDSFLTQQHDVLRLRWLLRDPDPETAAQLADLADVVRSRDDHLALYDGLTGDAALPSWAPTSLATPTAQVADLARDLATIAPLCPDDTVGADLAGLTATLADDLARPPDTVLDQLHQLRRELIGRSGARAWLIGGDASLAPLTANLPALVDALPTAERPPFEQPPSPPVVRGRLQTRDADADARFVGLVHPQGQGGVHIYTAPGAGWADRDPDVLWDHLTALRYGGHGSHGVFMQTWGAGLAYSNGIRVSADQGTIGYYAERCPELPQTLEFVLGVLDEPDDDPDLVDYALAEAFGSRAAGPYEQRGRSMAADLADGATPELVAGFRRALLDLAEADDAASQLAARHHDVYGRVMPGLGAPDPDAEFFVIGPERQLSAWEGWLQDELNAPLQRLWPRDFWITD